MLLTFLSQYADDMDVTMKAKPQCFRTLFNILEEFRQISGFTVNYDKTIIYGIGSIKDSDAKCYCEKELSWTNGPVNYLGVWLDYDAEVMYQKNFEELMAKATNILKTWAKRNLSLFGKILIINSLVSSLVYHRLLVLPTPPPPPPEILSAV